MVPSEGLASPFDDKFRIVGGPDTRDLEYDLVGLEIQPRRGGFVAAQRTSNPKDYMETSSFSTGIPLGMTASSWTWCTLTYKRIIVKNGVVGSMSPQEEPLEAVEILNDYNSSSLPLQYVLRANSTPSVNYTIAVKSDPSLFYYASELLTEIIILDCRETSLLKQQNMLLHILSDQNLTDATNNIALAVSSLLRADDEIRADTAVGAAFREETFVHFNRP
ncbi:hypothetical protein K469DRAFT_681346 [Zopfia rhizophila CBS 207.26]|uniref:Uncharacterized protein n=1 Tax=Zopfia rhizophila CBS 207.26 TaxID=1314779 RepID=A0A6A6EW01_9PEZI|nr:hypothetical protein K469DRAFT_681346 [Zopfia rhizophila CBS 207.26]